MASLIYLDTHVVVWLYALGKDAVPPLVMERLLATEEIRISPMVRLELQYLYEIGRVSQPPLPVLDTLTTALDLQFCPAPFAAVIREAESQTWTRDPFDRLIVAQAALFGAMLISKDSTIQDHYPHAFWE
ncbi:hypothetical protein MIT9_P0734 [Methylomarinovum caldicuralii]|uniref:PIN domain-containing protein n=1 Tax=Methylomarinovum caldicuralii TaxID=438856 RepID=A0AAU9C702_9GAMM|nr:PIN domain-containing protein [Methylomarinovum caldicuralii]BCX81156.1 hypothetical protein MIT9_P0734 [Methylomarinovum caldicuralii]